MDRLLGSLQAYWPFLAIISLAIAHGLIAQSALQFLNDDQKVVLVDAMPKYNWAYLALVIAFGSFFVDVTLGVVAIALYLISAMSFNYVWAAKNGFPPEYRYRVLLANLIVLGGAATFVVLAFLRQW